MRRPSRKLPVDERKLLAAMLLTNATETRVAETFGRDRLTVHRAIKRTGGSVKKSRRLTAIEFTSRCELYKGMGTRSWFCDPQVPRQKGSVENMNKRVRRYLPRDTARLSLPNRAMRPICDRLNATPRNCPGYRALAKAFRDELTKPERK